MPVDIKRVWGHIPGTPEFQTKRELASHNLYIVDLPRAAFHITSAITFTDFRDTRSLPNRKALKVGALFETVNRFYAATDNNSYFGLPANTILDAPNTFYCKLEECCVQLPGQYDMYAQPNSVEAGLEHDLEFIFPKGVPETLTQEIAEFLTTGLGMRLASNPQESLEWRKIAATTTFNYRWLAKRNGLEGISVDGAAPHVIKLFEELHAQAQNLKSNSSGTTELIRKIQIQ